MKPTLINGANIYLCSSKKTQPGFFFFRVNKTDAKACSNKTGGYQLKMDFQVTGGWWL
jgi:hypothetical protein